MGLTTRSGPLPWVTDTEPIGPRSVSFVVDLGRARWEAIADLLARLTQLHTTTPLERVLLGEGRLPEDA